MRKGSKLLTWKQSYDLHYEESWIQLLLSVSRPREISVVEAKAIVQDCADKLGIRAPWDR